MRIAALLALACCATAQSYSSHNGWSFEDTLGTASDVVVADLVSGSAVDSGSRVTVQAVLRVVRVLTGDLPAGGDLQLRWNYQPGPTEGPGVTTKVNPARGLWFLHRNPQGGLEPLQAGMMSPMGGFYLPAAAAPLPSDGGLTPAARIAHEIAGSLQGVAPVAADSADTRRRYWTLIMALQSLDNSATADVYRQFSALPDAQLKALGILGRLRAGDHSAILELEKNLPAIASTLDVNPPLQPLGMDLRQDLPAARSLARIALGETAIPGLESSLPFTLATTRSAEFLPYFLVLLDSPDAGVRGGTLMSFCPLLGPLPTPSPWWEAAMADHCPNHSPLTERDREQTDILFWKQWWDARRPDIARQLELPLPTAPARYSARPAGGSAGFMEAPPEVRFESLLNMTAARGPDHYHEADGTIVASPPPASPSPLRGRLNAADEDVFQQVAWAVAAKLSANQARSQQIMNAARMAGTQPKLEQLRALNEERQSTLRAGLEDLRSRLSAEGWRAVEDFMKSMGIVGVRAGAPR